MDGTSRLARAVIRQAFQDVIDGEWADAHRAFRWLTSGSHDVAFWIAVSGLRLNTW